MHYPSRTLGFAVLLLSASVLAGQSTQQNRSRSFAPGTCGPVDPTYIRTAEATGGIPFFFQRSEIPQSTKFMIASGSSNHVTVLWAKGSLQNSARDFDVPIDSTLSQVVFTLSTDSRDTKLEVFDPANSSVAGKPNADTTDFTCGRYIILKNPAPGSYRLHVTGSGRYWLSVGGKSELFVHAVEFVELGGRPGHEGMFAIHGQPIVGKPAHLQAIVAGEAKHVRFQLISPEGQPLQQIQMRSIHVDSDDQEFAGSASLPAQPFRIVATGVDGTGQHFQRVHEALISPSTLSLVLLNATDLNTGKRATFTFQITNLGNTEKFRITAVCANGWATHADRPDVTLVRGDSAMALMTVDVPAGVSPYTGADFILTATGEGDPNVSNSFVQRFSVEPSQP